MGLVRVGVGMDGVHGDSKKMLVWHASIQLKAVPRTGLHVQEFWC